MENINNLFPNLWAIIGGIIVIIAILGLIISLVDAKKWFLKRFPERIRASQNVKITNVKVKTKKSNHMNKVTAEVSRL